MSILEINIVPVGTSNTSYSCFVQDGVKFLDRRGFKSNKHLERLFFFGYCLCQLVYRISQAV